MSKTVVKRLSWGALAAIALIIFLDRPFFAQGSESNQDWSFYQENPLADTGDTIEGIPPRIAQDDAGEGEATEEATNEATNEAESTPEAPADGEAEQPEASGVTEVGVGIYVISVDELNLAENFFVMTFYLSLTCETDCDPSGFEFTNGTVQYLDLLVDEPLYKSYKAQILVRQNFEVQRFPFDEHDLLITLEDGSRTTEQFIYVVNEQLTDFAPEVSVSGWDLNPTHGAYVEDYFYPNFNETYSRYHFRMEISRPWISTIFKALLPIAVLIMVVYSLLWMSIDRASEFLEMTTNGLVGAILHHLYLSSLIPPTGYMTLMDAIMSVAYVMFVVVLFLLIRITMLVDEEKREAAEAWHKAAIFWVPVVLIGFQVMNFVLWFFVFV